MSVHVSASSQRPQEDGGAASWPPESSPSHDHLVMWFEAVHLACGTHTLPAKQGTEAAH